MPITRLDISYRSILKIAVPIMLGGIAQNIINVTDTAFLSRLGEVALGAGALGSIYYITLVMLGFGLGMGTQILIARRFGEGRLKDIGALFDNGIYIVGALGIALFFFLRFATRPILSSFISSPEILAQTLILLKWRAFGIPLAQVSFAFRFFY